MRGRTRRDTIGMKGRDIIIQGDNLKALEALLSEGRGESVDFIYIDPPYFTGSGYGAYSDVWKGGMEEYLSELGSRIALMRDMLAPTGTIAVHLDWHAVHYVKVEMDRIFGYRNFVNELVWCYRSGGASKKSFAKKHDNILVYSKGKSWYFKPQKEKSYNRGGKPYRFKGVEEFEDEGGWYTMVNHRDVLNLDMVGRSSGERTGYPTQKPEKLMELLLASFAPPGGMTADFYAGSGSFPFCAARSGRGFIACDSEKEAADITRSRIDSLSIEYDSRTIY
jgi:DNA modification methylase